jgi:hypothetical protein
MKLDRLSVERTMPEPPQVSHLIRFSVLRPKSVPAQDRHSTTVVSGLTLMGVALAAPAAILFPRPKGAQ